MMNWSEWLYIAIGLSLGVGSQWLFKRLTPPVSSIASQEADRENKALLQRLQQAKLGHHLAHEVSQFKAGYLARVSHELRSPLNSLIGLHQLILSDLCDNPAEEREFVAQAHESALRLVKLLDEILDVARMEHGTVPLDIQPLQLTCLLQEVHQLTHLLVEDRNFAFKLSFSLPDVYILADPRCLRQVLVSLVEICLAQMEEGSISVSAQLAPETEAKTLGNISTQEPVIFIWLDTSIPSSFWSEPVDLMQSQPTPKKTGFSPGLKLLLNQNLLELMQSRLELLPSAPDSTRFQITVPLCASEDNA